MNDDFWTVDFRRWNFKGRFHGVEFSSRKTKWEGSLQDMASEKKQCSFILELNAHILLIFPFQRGNSQILRIRSSNCLQLYIYIYVYIYVYVYIYIYIYTDIQWYGSDPPISPISGSHVRNSSSPKQFHGLTSYSYDRIFPRTAARRKIHGRHNWQSRQKFGFRWWPLVVLLRCPHMVGWFVEEQRPLPIFSPWKSRRLGMMKISWELRIMKASWPFSCKKTQNMWVWEPNLYNSGNGRGCLTCCL